MSKRYLVIFLLSILLGTGCVRKPPPYVFGEIPTIEQLPLMTDAQKIQGMEVLLGKYPLLKRTAEQKTEDSSTARQILSGGTPERLANFQAKMKNAEGMAWIVKRGEENVLVFGDDFHVEAGPSLLVVLSPEVSPSADSLFASSDTFEVGPLISLEGGQSYILPPTVDIAKFRSMVIMNKSFRALFAVAPIE